MINDAKVVKKEFHWTTHNFFLPLRFNSSRYEKESQVIFDKNVIEFVTVAAEFCAFWNVPKV